MAKLSKDNSVGTLHPREAAFVTGTLALLNAEVVLDGDGASLVTLDLRGTFVGTVEVQASVDGTNFITLPLRSTAVPAYSLSATTAGIYLVPAAGYRKLRARMTAFTSGAAMATLVASTGILDDRLMGESYNLAITATGAAGAGVTLTIPAPAAGLRQYIGSIHIERHATALLTAGATPVLVTSTNIPGTPTFSVPADAAAQGTIYEKIIHLGRPIAANAQATAVTVVAPATTTTIWRLTAYYYVAP